MTGGVQVRRVYDEPDPGDGTRVLVDCSWPGGLIQSRAALDEWCENVAPSGDLTRWYGHDPDRLAEFCRRYQVELKDPRRAEALAHLRELAKANRLTLLTATTRVGISAAAVLASLLRDRQGGEHSTTPAADIVHECGLGSFPASDPPSWWAHAGTG